MSTIAAVLGVGTGGAYAVDKLGKDSVGPQQIKSGAVRSAEVKDRSLTSRDLAPGAIVSSRLRTGAVDSRSFRDGGVGTQDVATGAIDSRSIRDGGVGEQDVATGAIDSRSIRDGGLGPHDVSFPTLKSDITGAIQGSGLSQSTKRTLTGDFSTVASIQVTATKSGLLSLGSINLENTAAGESTRVIYQVVVDGQPQGGEFTQDLEPGQTVAAPVAVVAPAVGPGAHTVELQARITIGAASVGARNLGAIAGITTPFL